jgi:hypothetical protein
LKRIFGFSSGADGAQRSLVGFPEGWKTMSKNTL